MLYEGKTRQELLEEAAKLLNDGYFYIQRTPFCKLMQPIPLYGEYKPCTCLPCKILALKQALNPGPTTIDIKVKEDMPKGEAWLTHCGRIVARFVNIGGKDESD